MRRDRQCLVFSERDTVMVWLLSYIKRHCAMDKNRQVCIICRADTYIVSRPSQHGMKLSHTPTRGMVAGG